MTAAQRALIPLTFAAAVIAAFIFTGPDEDQPHLPISWNPNPEPNIAGYRIWINAPEVSPVAIDVGNVTSYLLPLADIEGAESLQMTAYDVWGLESRKSRHFWLIPRQSIEFEAVLVIEDTRTLDGGWSEFAVHRIPVVDSDPYGQRFFRARVSMRTK